ncbi:MAG TPA: hypothetical protein VMH02_08210, partial [Verrucomicrobiae bacterium]|nr:hypothetical protein [Verrucomicrobiae bacterium]
MKLFDPQRWAARSVAALLFCAALPLAGAPALASGTMRIQHYYGGANVYNGVGIKVIHDALYITSPDGKGTIVINRAA